MVKENRVVQEEPQATSTSFSCALHQRRAGVLLHPSSLPNTHDSTVESNDERITASVQDVPRSNELGELGPEAFRFIDFLAAAGFSVWQVLPLGPTHSDLSPYMSPSAHAGNPRLISLYKLQEWGWLQKNDDLGRDLTPSNSANAVMSDQDSQQRRRKMLRAARMGFDAHASEEDRLAIQKFCEIHQFWLEDYAIYQALRQEHRGQPWVNWPEALRDREPEAINAAYVRLADDVAQARFEQYVFFRQWTDIKRYANQHGIDMFGDMPIFVAHDSAEVWAQRQYFDLDNSGQPRTVAGVPPDYFSETGQRWGNPHYRWDRMAEDGYQWWITRLQAAMELFDLVRIDHFRGFEAFWEIPATAETAMEGRWVPGPGDKFFAAIQQAIPNLPLVAEDLGIITPEVEKLRDDYAMPGMKILQFAFDGGPDNPYLPHNHCENSVVYTGTHDNNTTLGWLEELEPDMQQHIRDYLAENLNEDLTNHRHVEMLWALIGVALDSCARLTIIPFQDLLEMDGNARMNTPSQTEGNWRWRFKWTQVPTHLAEKLADLITHCGRKP
ncbi:MAG: 4-alpha-glucanotransferase [Ectothiorhodospiraceae bacterium]|nr:4-alpha-glucanotransferase [Ectothiorhodospiraceae bacterium]